MICKPKCIIVTGRAGAGKTTFSKELGRKLWMPVISRDEIKEGYVNTFGVKHDLLPADINALVTDFFFEIVNQFLENKVSVIIEAAFQHKVWEPRVARISEISRPFVIVCSIDDNIAAKRHLQRGLNEPQRTFYHEDKRVSIYKETGIISPPAPYEVPKLNIPTIYVSTDGKYSPTVDAIAEKIGLQFTGDAEV